MHTCIYTEYLTTRDEETQEQAQIVRDTSNGRYCVTEQVKYGYKYG